MSETIRATFEADPDDFMKLDEESISAALKQSAIDEVIAELQLTDLDFQIAEEAGLTREELIENAAYDRLTNPELFKKRDTGRSATELLADRILRDKQRTAKADERKPNVSKASIKAAMAVIEDELEPSVEDLQIAARIGITREELITQRAMDKLTPDELRLIRAGLTPVEILASRTDR
ncbi:MAG TPA: hypothetical protein VGR87_06050 [Candidatus Limnocylindria bacterium]|jgi:DNA-directed RNA polymerase specialized sigma subunit|nr:hypothetical protein [Candidatus Limnocylindria bacterium]